VNEKDFSEEKQAFRLPANRTLTKVFRR
jgi:hypothetical protein